MTKKSYIIKKSSIAYCLFTVILCYIISPWFFEKKLLFNELLASAGFAILIYRRGRIGRDPLSFYISALLFWGMVHAIVSLFRMDSFYYYLRNLVIIYSVLTFFIGYYCLKYLDGFIARIRKFLRVYIGVFLFIPQSKFIFERFGMAMLFPALFKDPKRKWVPYLLIVMNLIYGVTYDSLTAWLLAAFYFLLFISPGYKFFCQVFFLMVAVFAAVFIYLIPNLNIIRLHYNPYDNKAIWEVIRSHPILSIDGNSTWRMVLWKQILVDDFPRNIFGLGFGTPALKYYPVEDYTKLDTLPYLLGSHNSYVYLFGRLGIVYLLLIVPIYLCIFREYFYFKSYYSSNRQILLFWSFFAITIIASFNPTLESPIYAGAYWLLMGFIARGIHNRRLTVQNSKQAP